MAKKSDGTSSQVTSNVGIKNEAIEELGLSSRALIHHIKPWKCLLGCVQKKKKRKKKSYLLRTPVTPAHIVTLLQELKNLGNGSFLLAQLLHLERLATATCLLLQVLKRLLDELDILDPQFLVDDGQIPDGVDVTLNVNDLGIIETPDDLENGIDGTNVRQESVTQTSTSGGTTGQTGNIINRQVGGDLGLGLVVIAKPVEALIRDDHTSFFGVDGSIGEVGRVTQRRLGNSLEESRLANIGQSNL